MINIYILYKDKLLKRNTESREVNVKKKKKAKT